MAAVLLLIAMMASPITTARTTSSVMRTNNSSGEVPVRTAQVRHNWIFGAYVLLLGLTVIGTYLVWSSGNKVQDAIQSDATARIAEAQSTASQADARSRQLEKDNLTLQGQVAGLQKDASNAKSAQLEVEKKLSAQEADTARAKSDLAKLQTLVQWRTVTLEQRKNFLTATMSKPKGEVHVKAQADDPESISFANELRQMLTDAGFYVPPVATAYVVGVGSIGLSLEVDSAATLTHPDPNMPGKYFIPNGSPVIHSGAVKAGLNAAGIAANVNIRSGSRNNEVALQVGRKP